MAVAQGLYKTLAYKKQTGLGAAASGAGGTLLRRETAIFNKMKGTYDANEIVSHQQDTGIAYLVSTTQGEINGVLSAGSYAPLLGSLLRGSFTAGAVITGLSLTISGLGPFSLTRAAGSYLTDGLKVGDVVRITAGTFTGVALNLNLVVLALTPLVATVIVANGKVLTAQGPIASASLTVVGKKAVVPTTGQANDYYTFEEWFADTSLSRVYSDVQVASVDVSIPPSAAASVKMALLGLARAKSATQVLTAPASAPTTAILSAVNGVILINAGQTIVGTSINLKIDGQVTHGEAVIGSKVISDMVKGDLKVGGSFTNLKQDEAYSNLFDNETPVGIVAVLFADGTDTSDFVNFNIPRVKLTKDDIDDGKKQIISTHDFVAEFNASGGAGTTADTGIMTIQDSQA
jgi:Phage tail tube protein